MVVPYAKFQDGNTQLFTTPLKMEDPPSGILTLTLRHCQHLTWLKGITTKLCETKIHAQKRNCVHFPCMIEQESSTPGPRHSWSSAPWPPGCTSTGALIRGRSPGGAQPWPQMADTAECMALPVQFVWESLPGHGKFFSH